MVYECRPTKITLFKFEGIEEDVYNPSKPFRFDGKDLIAARVEPRENEESEVMFFKYGNICYKCDTMPTLKNMQDPFICEIDNNIIFGMVEYTDGNYKTVLMDENFEKIVEINKMKCIRFAKLPNDEIGVFLRPTIEQNQKYGKGKIYYTTIDSLDELRNFKEIEDKMSLIDILPPNTWGGVNDVAVINENKMLVLGHIAYEKNNMKNYYPIIFNFDYDKKEFSDPVIVGRREDFFIRGAKNCPLLLNVVYPNGFNLNKNYIDIYVGISDFLAGKIMVKNPFI